MGTIEKCVCAGVCVCVCVCVCVLCVCLTNVPIKAEVEWPKLNLEVTFICEMTRKNMNNNNVMCGHGTECKDCCCLWSW